MIAHSPRFSFRISEGRQGDVSWPYFDIRDLEFVPQSQAVEIVERFRLSEDATELRMDIAVTDPAAFVEPVVADDYAVWRWRPGVRVEPYNCTLD